MPYRQAQVGEWQSTNLALKIGCLMMNSFLRNIDWDHLRFGIIYFEVSRDSKAA
jgi:hypothetical protein